jgi:hypothetical protein
MLAATLPERATASSRSRNSAFGHLPRTVDQLLHLLVDLGERAASPRADREPTEHQRVEERARRRPERRFAAAVCSDPIALTADCIWRSASSCRRPSAS